MAMEEAIFRKPERDVLYSAGHLKKKKKKKSNWLFPNFLIYKRIFFCLLEISRLLKYDPNAAQFSKNDKILRSPSRQS